MRGVRQGALLLLTAVASAAIAACDLALGPGASLAGLLMIGPLVAATRLEGACTAAVSFTALFLGLAVPWHERTLGRTDQLLALTVLAAAAAYATWASDRQAVLDSQLAGVAAAAQRAILRPTSFRVSGASVCARYRSAAPRAVIGGDLYAFADTPSGLRVLIGDVRGKGLEAVRLSAAAIGHFRDCAYTRANLAEVVEETDRRLIDDLGPEDFITAVIAEISPGRLRLANCGHHPPLHLPAAGPPVLLTPAEPTTPIGLHPVPRVQEVELAPGDRLLLYTDGLAEARDPDGTMLDLAGLLPACSMPDLNDAIETVLATMCRHTHGAQDDDVALVLVELEPSLPRQHRGHAPPTAARTRAEQPGRGHDQACRPSRSAAVSD
ncbi:PP2C family protein-serine/threonine phosphatase [Streptomyces sp. NPDC017529]|uniref:PP2C family protein-serine/threonine phosphatase n=1 Tax=Streptomyces sp. NPDC017529 TaxID=3365000 RepID=UPI00379561BC